MGYVPALDSHWGGSCSVNSGDFLPKTTHDPSLRANDYQMTEVVKKNLISPKCRRRVDYTDDQLSDY